MGYRHTVTVALAWEEAAQRSREALAEHGFGIVSEIDVRATFASKLGAGAAEDLGDYITLRACSPALASRAPSAEPDVGALLQRRRPPGQGFGRDDRPGYRSAGHGEAQRQPGRPQATPEPERPRGRSSEGDGSRTRVVMDQSQGPTARMSSSPRRRPAQ